METIATMLKERLDEERLETVFEALLGEATIKLSRMSIGALLAAHDAVDAISYAHRLHHPDLLSGLLSEVNKLADKLTALAEEANPTDKTAS